MAMGMSEDRILQGRQIDKQMGCMPGFRHLLDCHQILSGKRFHHVKSLPPSPALDSSPQLDKFIAPPPLSGESHQQKQQAPFSPELVKLSVADDAKETEGSPSLDAHTTPPATPPPAETPARVPFPLPLLESKDRLRASWKLKEAPRLSLDSRATIDAKGSVFPREIQTNTKILAAGNCDARLSRAEEESDKQRRSPNVVARLMGLEEFPGSVAEPTKNAELRRSSSESRVSRDLVKYMFIENTGFQNKQLPFQKLSNSGSVRCYAVPNDAFPAARSKASKMPDPADIKYRVSKCGLLKDSISNPSLPWKMRRIFFDSQDFFPEPRQTVSLYGEIEKRLKMRGIDEPAKDLETLKQILEALQLKGLLHLKNTGKQIRERRKLIYDRQIDPDKASIVVLKPGTSPAPFNRPGRVARPKAGMRRNLTTEPPSPARRGQLEANRNSQSEKRSRCSNSSETSNGGAKSPSSLARKKANSSVDPQKKRKDSNDHGKACSSSPKIGVKKSLPAGASAPIRSSRLRRPTTEASPKGRISSLEKDDSTISDSRISTPSQINCERPRMAEMKRGRSLLDQCDELIHGIGQVAAAGKQANPVSVLDASATTEDSSLSSVVRQSFDFQDGSTGSKEDWSPEAPLARSAKPEEQSDEIQLTYVSEILSGRTEGAAASHLFASLEKHYASSGKSSSLLTRPHRRLIFDAVSEILDQKQQLSPWRAFLRCRSAATSVAAVQQQVLLRKVWSELVRMRERALGESLAVDMGAGGWCGRCAGTRHAALDIERLIFKDLVGEAIRDLSGFAEKRSVSAPRRKLAF